MVAVPDEPPKLAVRLRGIGSAITPRAALPVEGRISDDCGLGRIWFEHSPGDGEPRRTAIGLPSAGATELQIDRVLDCRDFPDKEISPGGRLLVSVKAADRSNLAEAPNVGTSDEWLLDVVAPERLRTMLESRELALRQRFEAIIAEASETRDALARMPLGSLAAGQGGTALRVERAAQNCRKSAHEILALAQSFENIREELINNRIDSEELKARLQEGIAAPLKRIAEQRIPELEHRLADLLDSLADDAVAPERRDRAVAESDAVLAAMREVLSRMIELEDFNEAIAVLRQIIEKQETLNRQTEQSHKDRLRGLLEE